LDNSSLYDVVAVERVIRGGDGIVKCRIGETNLLLNSRRDVDLRSLISGLDAIESGKLLGLFERGIE
jgi:hypothetical protein